MVFVQVCVGSSCHLKGSEDIVGMLQKGIESHGIENEVALGGSFCIGKCNIDGVTVQVDDDIFPGITRDNFNQFFTENILAKTESR